MLNIVNTIPAKNQHVSIAIVGMLPCCSSIWLKTPLFLAYSNHGRSYSTARLTLIHILKTEAALMQFIHILL